MALASLTVDLKLALGQLESDSGKAAQIINRDAQKMAVATEKADAAVRRLTQSYTQVGVESKIVAAAAAGASDSALRLFASVTSGATAFAAVGASGVAAFKAIGVSSEDATKAAEARILLLAEKVRQVKDQSAGLVKEAVVGRETGKFDDDSLKKRLADIRLVEKAELQRIADVASADAAARRAAVAERLAASKGATSALAASAIEKSGAQTTVFLGAAAAQEDQQITLARREATEKLIESVRRLNYEKARGNQVAGDNFLESLREQNFAIGKTREELLRLQAVKLGVQGDATPLIQGLGQREFIAEINAQTQAQRQLRAEMGLTEEQVLQLRRAELGLAEDTGRAITQLQALKASNVKSQGDAAFIAGLQEQVEAQRRLAAEFGKTEAEVLQLRAAERGLSEQTSGTIAELQKLTGANRQAAEAKEKLDKATSGNNAFLAQLEREANAVGKTRSEIVALEAAQRGITEKAAPLIQRLRDLEEKTGQFGKSAFASRNQLLTLQYTISDVIASAGSGISPLTILLQQGGQVFDAFGGASAQGKGGFFRNFVGAIAQIVTPARLALAGLAGSIGAVAYASFQGAEDSKKFADAQLLTGNYAGATAGAYSALARSIAASSEITVAAARESALALINTGEVGPRVFASATEAAARYADATSKNAKEVAQDFATMGRDVAKWATEHNRQLNFITAAQFDQIKSLQEQGRAAEAQAIVYDALNQRLRGLDANLGTLDRILKTVKGGWSSFWDAAFDIGRPETIEDRIERAGKAVDALKARRDSGRASLPAFSSAPALRESDNSGDRAAKLQVTAAAELAQLQREKLRKDDAAFAQADRADTTKRAIDAKALIEGYQKSGKAASEYKKAVEELTRAFKDNAEAGTPISKEAQAEAFAGLKKKFENKSAVNSANDQRKAILDQDLKLLRDQLAREQDVLKFNQAELQAIYNSSAVSIQEFYDKKEKTIADGVARELQFVNFERARLQVELDRGKFKDPADRTRTQTQLNEATEKAANLERDAAFAAKLAAYERAAAFKALSDRVTDYRAQLLQLAGDEEGAAKIRANAAIEAAKLFAKTTQGTSFAVSQDDLDRQSFLIRQTNEFGEVQRRAALASQDAGRAEETFLLRAAQRGADLQETERGVFQLRSAALEQLGRLTEQAQALAAASTDPKVVQFAKDLELQYARAADAIDPAVLRLRQAGQELSSGIANSLNQTSTNFSSLYGARLDTSAKDAQDRRNGLNQEIKDLQDTLGKTTNDLDRKRLNERIVSLQRELASVKEESRFAVLLKTFERDVLKPLVQQAASSIQKVLITDPLQKYIEAQLRGLTENGGALSSFFSDISGSRGLNVDKNGLGIDTKGFSQAQDSAAAFELVNASATATASATDLQTAAVTNSTTAVTSMAAAAELAAQALNRISISAGGSGISGAIGGGGGFGTGSNFGNQDLGAFLADGTNYVPYDGFRAVLHKGEAVVPAKFNQDSGKGGNVYVTNNMGGQAAVTAERDSNGDFQVLIDAAAARAHQMVANDHASGNGPSSRALKSRGVNLNSTLARRG